MTLRLMTSLVLVFSATTQCFFVNFATPPATGTHTRTRLPVANFFDDAERMFKQMFDPKPTLEEAMMYCRDDESNGCTVDMCACSCTQIRAWP